MKACEGSGGIITQIAKRLAVHRTTVYDYIRENPEMVKYIQSAKEEVLDVAKAKVIKSVDMATPKGEWEDVKWYLSRFGETNSDNQININNQIQNIATYKVIIEKPNDIRNKVETEPESVKSI